MTSKKPKTKQKNPTHYLDAKCRSWDLKSRIDLQVLRLLHALGGKCTHTQTEFSFAVKNSAFMQVTDKGFTAKLCSEAERI